MTGRNESQSSGHKFGFNLREPISPDFPHEPNRNVMPTAPPFRAGQCGVFKAFRS